MPAETVHLALELDIPLTVVHEVVKRHLVRTLLQSITGHGTESGNGQAPHPDGKEDPAPAPASGAGAP
jgi:hypothetical protein